jgi:hypothetical protein
MALPFGVGWDDPFRRYHGEYIYQTVKNGAIRKGHCKDDPVPAKSALLGLAYTEKKNPPIMRITYGT